MNPRRLSAVAMVLGVAGLAVVGLWSVSSMGGSDEPVAEAVSAPLTAARPTLTWRPAEPRAEAFKASPVPTHVVDSPEEQRMASLAYAQRIHDNLRHLERASQRALDEGHPARAALMERRMEGLKRRLQEHAEDAGSR